MGTVSHSEVDSYLLCRRKHYYGYSLSLQRMSESHSLAMGTAGHRILETFYKAIGEGFSAKTQLEYFDKALAEAKVEYETILSEGFEEDPKKNSLYNALFNEGIGYFAQEPFVKNGYEILAIEKDFNLLYDDENQSHYPFVVDLIVRDPDGKLVVVDHKFVYDFYTVEASDMQPQIPKYIGALRALGYDISHGAYNMIRTRKIKEPTAEQMHHFMLLKPNTARVKTTFLEQIHVADEVQAIKSLPIETQEERAFRVANKMVCQSCSFRDLCSTELIGGNVELMLRTEYKIRERREFTTTSQENTEE